MVIFKKPSARKAASTVSIPPPDFAVATTQKSIQWSDITAGRESTHPNVISDRVKRFFAVFEIYEDILDHLGRKDLFRAQFICHIFKDTIAESSRLGRKLFLKPALAKQTLRWATTAGDFESQGRLLAGSKAASALQGHEDADTESPDTSEVESPRIQSLQPYVLNPFLFHLHPWAKSKTVLGTAQEFVAGKLAGSYSLGLTLNKDTYALTTAMSQDMYLTQPPVKEVCLLLRKLCSHLVCNHDNYHRHCEGIRGLDPYPRVRNEEGVTFGQVLQVAAPYLNRARHGTLKYIQVVDGLPVTMVEKEFVEAAGEVTEETDRIRRNIKVSRAKGETQHRKRSGGRATW
ncbi:hypothetical protein LTR27_012138 [Elasticomyces elasticus]|nr:hypothetical protein LTR27_012138 [Elasticomyces elasticus]